MAEFEQTLEEVCAMVASGAIMNNDRLARLARAFSEVSRPVISRLRRCDELLQKGLRSEALHLARTEPDLIEAVERLEFPNRDVWDNAIGIYGLVAAPRPSSSSAAALHRAFAEEEPRHARNCKRIPHHRPRSPAAPEQLGKGTCHRRSIRESHGAAGRS